MQFGYDSWRLISCLSSATTVGASFAALLISMTPSPPLPPQVGYDGWRLDFVRGFWGGHVKDYIEASAVRGGGGRSREGLY